MQCDAERRADALAGKINCGQHELSQRVYFEDTDFTGRVYHARYLQFMERGRSDYLRLIGIHHRALAAEGRAFAVRHMALDFLKPASIDDVLTVRTATVSRRRARGCCSARRCCAARSFSSRQW